MVEKKLQIIGLTGSIATGKSAVADILTSRGFHVRDADDAAKQLSAVGGAAHDEIATLFPTALLPDRTLDRKKLAAMVFADREKLAQLEKILHPKIKNLRDEFYASARQRGDKVVFIMVPLLFEKFIDQECDKTWVITSTPAVQSERALRRPGMTPELLNKIRASQMPDAEKIKRANVVIENNGTLDSLRQKIDSAIKTL